MALPVRIWKSDRGKSFLIISSPFEPPTHHWRRKSDSKLALIAGRRPAGYEISTPATTRSAASSWSGSIASGSGSMRGGRRLPRRDVVTRQLLGHWQDGEISRQYAFYFCQLEAIETLIWHVEAPPDYKQGIAIRATAARGSACAARWRPAAARRR
jgi:type III restriction enzyme